MDASTPADNLFKEQMTRMGDMIHRWQHQLAIKVDRTAEAIVTDKLWCYDFPPGGVRITFEDGSHAVFNNAFYLMQDGGFKMRVAAVFTEHCGYHEFILTPDDKIEDFPGPEGAAEET